VVLWAVRRRAEHFTYAQVEPIESSSRQRAREPRRPSVQDAVGVEDPVLQIPLGVGEDFELTLAFGLLEVGHRLRERLARLIHTERCSVTGRLP
jgi:hypothetical protein